MAKQLIAGGLLLLLSAPAVALTPEELFEKLSKSVYVVHVYDKEGRRFSQGSGVVIGPERMVTNCHVLAKGVGVRVSRGNVSFGATLEYPDPARDLCQLKVPELFAPAVALGSVSAVRVGQRVYAIGSPEGLELTLSDGLVSALRELEEGKAPVIQTSSPISPGSSGGGLFDAQGQLIGITTFQFRGQQLNFAVPADWVRELPERGREVLAKRKEAAEARAAAAAKASGTVVAAAPVDPSLPKEMPQAGDTWTYVVRDLMYRPNDRSRKFVHTVRQATRGSIVEVVTGPGVPSEESAHSETVDAVYRTGADVVELAPFVFAFRKLQSGEQWSAIPIRQMESTPFAATEAPYIIERATVVGTERVQVPAGSFDAVRIDIQGRVSMRFLSRGRAVVQSYAKFTQTVWYAPPVKRTVKIAFEGPNFQTAYELESYTLR